MAAPYKTERRARAELEKFVHHFYAREDGMPKGIDPAFVESFVRAALRREVPKPTPARQLVELADYYDRRALVPDLRARLEELLGGGGEDAFDTLVELARGLAILGGGDDRAVAAGAFARLLLARAAEERADELTALWVELAPEVGADALAGFFGATAARLRRSPEPADQMQARELADAANALPLAAAAVTRRVEIEALEADARLDRLADIYLGLDLDYHAFLARWAVRRILRDAQALGDEPIANAFARALGRVDAALPDEEERAPMRACALHAMERFGRALGVRERRQMLPRAKRFELLAGE